MRRIQGWQIAAVCAALIGGNAWAFAAPDGKDSLPPPPPKQQDQPAAAEPAKKSDDKTNGKAKDEARDKDDAKDKDGSARGERIRQRIFEQMFRDIELTPEQNEQVKAVLDKHHKAHRAWMDEHREEFRDAWRALREAKQSEDEAKIEAAKRDLKKLFESSPNRHEATDEVQALLTDGQKETFNRNVEAMRSRGRDRGTRGGDAGAKGEPSGDDAHGDRGGRADARGDEGSTPPPPEEQSPPQSEDKPDR